MQTFIEVLSDGDRTDRLSIAISGRGAFLPLQARPRALARRARSRVRVLRRAPAGSRPSLARRRGVLTSRVGVCHLPMTRPVRKSAMVTVALVACWDGLCILSAGTRRSRRGLQSAPGPLPRRSSELRARGRLRTERHGDEAARHRDVGRGDRPGISALQSAPRGRERLAGVLLHLPGRR